MTSRSSTGHLGGAAADLHGRWLVWPWLHPFASAYGEERIGREIRGRDFPNAYRLRSLIGVALPSQLGDVLVYGFGDVRRRYGLNILTEEATLGLGIRLIAGIGEALEPAGLLSATARTHR